MIPLELALGFGIGLSLGSLGGWWFTSNGPRARLSGGTDSAAAMTTSLAIVGVNSLIGALIHRTQGTLAWKVALIFGGAGMLALYR